MSLDQEKNIEIEKKDITPQDKKEEQNDIPQYLSKLELKKDDQNRIIEEICKELDEIDLERKADGMEEHWDEMDNLYNGKLRESEDQQFNLSKRTAKIKTQAIVRAAGEAFFESDPRFSITPRPEFDLKDGAQVTEKQENFLDYKFDEVIPLEAPLMKTILSAVTKGTGILKLFWETRRCSKKREETYVGKNEPVLDPRTNQPVLGQDGMPVVKNEALQNFVRNYPTAQDPGSKYHPYFLELQRGKTINIVVKYKAIEYSDPMPRYVNRKDFYCRKADEGYMGLCRSRFHGEKISYSWWDLKKMEQENEHFYNIDELIYENDEDKAENKPKINYDHKDYDIHECVYWTKLKDSDKEETRCTFWVERKRKIMIGSISYPFYDVDSYYIPFHVKEERAGFDQPGVAEDLKDTCIAEDAILNFTLEGWWATNQVTPITMEGSEIESQFLEKRWGHGVPLTLKTGETPPRFLNEFMKPMDAGNGINLIQYLIQGQDDVSGVSSLLSGRESPVDPTAPAAKTLALLERSGINIKAYIRVLVKSFNLIPQISLMYYDQMNSEGVKYRIRETAEQVTGANPFGVISKAELRAKTTIQSQASAFNFNKNNEKREDLALFSTVRTEPLIARNPKAVYELLKNLIKGWSPKWKNRIDKVLPSFEDFQREQSQMAVQAVAQYVQGALKQSQVTGVPPQFDMKQLIAAVADFTAEAATPPSPEVQKQRAKQGAQVLS